MPLAAPQAVGLDWKSPASAPRDVPLAMPRAAAKAKPEKLSEKQQIWIGTGMIAAAALVLVMVFVTLSLRHGHEVASTEEPQRSEVGALISDFRPPTSDLGPKPSADSGKAGDVNPPETIEKSAGPAPSSGGPAGPPPGGDLQDAGNGPKGPSSKGSVAVAEKPKSSGSAQLPQEKPAAAEAAAGPKEKTPEPDASPVPEEKLAVPGEAAQKQALAIIRETYQNDYRTADKVALGKLLAKADGSRSDAVARFVLLQEARKVAGEMGQWELALEAADALGSAYQVPAGEMKTAGRRPGGQDRSLRAGTAGGGRACLASHRRGGGGRQLRSRPAHGPAGAADGQPVLGPKAR